MGGDHERRSELQKPGANSFSTCYHGIARRLLSSRKASYGMHVQLRLDTIASTPCRFSTMHKRGSPYLSAPVPANTDQTCNTRCFWSGTPRRQHLRQTPHPLSPHLH